MVLTENQRQLLSEVEGLPAECLPSLVQMIRTFREKMFFESAADSLRQGWAEIQRDDSLPLEQMWEGIDAE